MTIITGLSLASVFGMFMLNRPNWDKSVEKLDPVNFHPTANQLYFPE